MVSVKGTFNNGVVHPVEAIEAKEGQQVIITLLEQENPTETSSDEISWDEMLDFIDTCAMDTGIEDLAHQHDHYIHGTPKREAYP